MYNYPPGVSGNEIEITGADEYTADRTVICWNEACRMFEKKQNLTLELSANRYEEWAEWNCPTCNKLETYEGNL
jgi:hypothetical protein